MKLTKEGFLNIITEYLKTEKEISSQKVQESPIELDSFDAFFDEISKPNIPEGTKEEKNFWLDNKDDITKLVQSNAFNGTEFRDIKEAMEIIRGKYLMNLTYSNIDKDYQDMCRVYITLMLQRKALGIENYLRYFDPNSAYYKRVFALNRFRNLDNPKEEIEDLFPIIGQNLYESVQLDPDSIGKATNIFKEYIERIFSLTRLDTDSRTDFLIQSDEYLDYFYEKTDLNEWILNLIEADEIAITDEDKDTKEEIETKEQEIKKDEEAKEQIIAEEKKKAEEFEKKNKEQTEEIEKLKKDSQEKATVIEEKDSVIEQKNSIILELQKKLERVQFENQNEINNQVQEKDQLIEELNRVRKENVDSKINNLEKQNELERKIELLQGVITELNKKQDNYQETSTKLLTIKEPVQEEPVGVDEVVKERRKLYRIIVIGGSDKMLKKYKGFMKNKEFENEITEEFGLTFKQFELEGDYKKQQDRKFVKKIEDALIFDKANFVIAIHTDHESGLKNLIDDPQYTTRITVFGEREENDANPAFGQSLSELSFKHYIKRALNKYERDLLNSNT